MRLRHLFVVLFYIMPGTGLALRNALSSNPPLRCCYMVQPPITFPNPRNVWQNGLDGVLKEHLLQHQSYLNWTCSSMLPFHQTDTTSFNDFVLSMYECTNKTTGQIIDSPNCKCDIGIGGWFQNPVRFGKVNFLPPFGYDRYVVFIHVSQATISGRNLFFVQTFDVRAWICIAALFVMFTFLKMLDRRFQPPAPYTPLPPSTNRFRRYLYHLTKSRLLYRLRKATQSTLMRMLMLSDEPVVTSGTTMRQWVLNMILAVTSLFLILSYEASMTASLVQGSIQARFESAADLQNCRIAPSETCILRGGAFEIYWNNSIAIDKCHERNPPQFYSSYETIYEAVKNGQCKYAIVIESSILTAIRERYCGEFVIVGQPIMNGGLSMLLPTGSNLTEPMSLATLALHGNQTEPSLNKYYNTLPKCEAEADSTLSFEKLKLFFIIAFSFGAGIFLAMVLVPQHASTESGSSRTRAAGAEQLAEGKMTRSWDAYSGEVHGAALPHGLRHNWLAHGVEVDAQCSQTVPGGWNWGRLWRTPSRAKAPTCANCCRQCATNAVALSWSPPWLAYAPRSQIEHRETDSDDESV